MSGSYKRSADLRDGFIETTTSILSKEYRMNMDNKTRKSFFQHKINLNAKTPLEFKLTIIKSCFYYRIFNQYFRMKN